MTADATGQSGIEDFTRYVRSYGTTMLRYALANSRQRVDAEDAVSETFQNLWKQWQKNPETVRGGGIGYALKALANTIKSQGRTRSRRPREVDWDSDLEQTQGLDDIEDTYLFGELQTELWAAVSTLEEIQQQLIFLHYVEGYSVTAAGRLLGLAKSTADRYHKIALDELKEIIAGPD